jgi:hypothetical protein
VFFIVLKFRKNHFQILLHKLTLTKVEAKEKQNVLIWKAILKIKIYSAELKNFAQL